jgi:exodeoxyribonuclease VII small subunit
MRIVREDDMKDKELDFEKALADLEKTVEKLEAGGLGLSESLALFEKGVKLARYLRDELDKAEKKVEILLKDDEGGFRSEPFDLGEEEAGAEPAADEPGRKTRSKPTRKKSEGSDDTLPF